MGKYRIILDGKTYEMEIERIDGERTIQQKTETKASPETRQAPPVPVQTTLAASALVQPSGGNTIKSPMPGTIVRVNAAAGDAVKQGQSVLVLEAMKMENDIAAPKDGTITALFVSQGDTVQGGSVLFEIGE